MRKIIRIICMLMIAVMIASAATVITSAAEYRTGTNSISSSYAASDYYKRFQQVPITGDGPTDAIAIALSQIGYQEGNSDGQFAGNASGSDNYTEFNYNMGSFGVGYGGSQYPWCACFVSFCLYQGQCHDQGKLSDWCRKNEGVEGYVWREVSCQQWVNQLKRFDMFKPKTYAPQSGDLIFFSTNGTSSSHIGIVLYADGSYVYTIEGNTSSGSELDVNGGGVYYKKYSLRNSKIFGYGVLPYERDASATIDYSGANPTLGLYVSTTNKYIYKNQGDSAHTWLLPKYSMFEVTEIVSNDLLKGVFTIGGETVEGYVMNNTDRIIQLSKADDGSIKPATSTSGFKNMVIDTYSLNDSPVSGDALIGTENDTFGILGWMGFNSEIESFGYSVDGLENPVFDSSFAAYTEDAIKAEANAGKYGQRFKIEVSGLSVGEHQINFLAKLANGKICIISTVNVTVEAAPELPEETTTVEETTTEEITETTEETTEEITEETTEVTTEEITTAPETTEVTTEEITTVPETTEVTTEEITTVPETTEVTTEEITTVPETTEETVESTEVITTAPEETSTEAETTTVSTTEETTEVVTDEVTEEATETDTTEKATEIVTEAPTTEADGTVGNVTEATTEVVTTAESQTESENTTVAEDSKGCGASLSAMSVLATLGVAVLTIKKKKED